MKITYTGEDGIEQTWDLEPGKLLNVEVIAIEKVTGLSFVEFGEALSKGSMDALTALVWLLRKRHGEPELRYRDVVFPIDALSIEGEDEQDAQDGAEGDGEGPEDEAGPKGPVPPSGDGGGS